MKNIIIFTTLFFLLATSAHARLYKWVDESGNVHYSNKIPPSKAYLGYDELSKNGIKKKTVISTEKKLALKAIADSQKEQKLIEAAEKKKALLVAEEDQRLLSIFSHEDEIIKSYNSKLRMSQLTIDLLKARHEKQSLRLAKLEKREERSKNQKHKDLLKVQISETIDNLRIYQEAITENILEKDRVNKDFKKTLTRYVKVKARNSIKNDSNKSIALMNSN